MEIWVFASAREYGITDIRIFKTKIEALDFIKNVYNYPLDESLVQSYFEHSSCDSVGIYYIKLKKDKL